jgi:hypothetical protein
MDPADAILAVAALAITGALAVTLGIAWFRASRRVRELERHLAGEKAATAVAALEASFVVLSDQVDQIANGQDFLSRLLTDQRLSPPVRPQHTPT